MVFVGTRILRCREACPTTISVLRRPEALRPSLASVGSTGARTGRSSAFKLANAASRIRGGLWCVMSTIGTKRTWGRCRANSAFGSEADVAWLLSNAASLGISEHSPRQNLRSTAQLVFDPSERRTMPRISPPPHPPRFRRKPGTWNLAIVAELPADFSPRQILSRSAADALCSVPEVIALPTRHSSVEMVEHAHSPTTDRTFKPDLLTNDATACLN
jgi:hypothetical protein